jgi:hypothetical protein
LSAAPAVKREAEEDWGKDSGASGMAGLVDRVSDHLKEMAAGSITKSTVHRLMGLLRELLEERGERKKYPVLAMYCDWAVHRKLDRSQQGSALLDMLDDVWALTANADEQIRVLLKGISPVTLRDQIIQLLGTVLVNPAMIIDVPSCTKIMVHLTEDLMDKPIARRREDLEKRKAERLNSGYRFMADRLFFECDQQGKRIIALVAKQIEPSIGGEVKTVIPWPY